MNYINNNPTTKKRTITALLSAALLKLYANIWLIALAIGIIMLITGFIIYETITVIHRILPNPPPNQTNEVTINVSTYLSGGNGGSGASSFTASQYISGSNNPFYLQYGLNQTNGIPWISVGTNIPQIRVLESPLPTTPFTEVDIYSDSNSFIFDMVDGWGTIFRYDYDMSVMGGNYPFIYPVYPIPVMIERSTDLVNWMPVFTNLNYGIYNAELFVDSNAPAGMSFYRAGQCFTNWPSIYIR